ncbi:hypothetical protein [Nitrosomonas communis]|nr:hypothetical protein [Nitrosomonas communis]
MAPGKRRLEQKMQMSFGSIELAQRLRQDSVLMKIDTLIDWAKLRPGLRGLYKRELTNGGGQEPFDVLMMFKAILLGQWPREGKIGRGRMSSREVIKYGEIRHDDRKRAAHPHGRASRHVQSYARLACLDALSHPEQGLVPIASPAREVGLHNRDKKTKSPTAT